MTVSASSIPKALAESGNSPTMNAVVRSQPERRGHQRRSSSNRSPGSKAVGDRSCQQAAEADQRRSQFCRLQRTYGQHRPDGVSPCRIHYDTRPCTGSGGQHLQPSAAPSTTVMPPHSSSSRPRPFSVRAYAQKLFERRQITNLVVCMSSLLPSLRKGKRKRGERNGRMFSAGTGPVCILL